jgi:hypothetical protein
MAGVRGYCVAFLAAFDKHWNLALEDVHEVWTRRKRSKVPALGKAVVKTQSSSFRKLSCLLVQWPLKHVAGIYAVVCERLNTNTAPLSGLEFSTNFI